MKKKKRDRKGEGRELGVEVVDFRRQKNVRRQNSISSFLVTSFMDKL